jgi:hypothetical protein
MYCIVFCPILVQTKVQVTFLSSGIQLSLRLSVMHEAFCRLGIKYRSYLQGSINRRIIVSCSSSWSALTLKMGPIVCPETSVTTKLRYVTSQKSANLVYTAVDA